MRFRDAQVEDVYRRNFEASGDLDVSQRQICGLFAAYDWFYRIEGDLSPRVIEAKELLLCAEMRPALRFWYQRIGDGINPAAKELREQLGELAGEKFGEMK